MAIFLTSDLHFGHDREFLWGPRGFQSSLEHDEAIIANWNSVVTPEDHVYVLGDLMLEDDVYGASCVRRLNGHLHLVRGNHDSDRRWKEIYPWLPNVVELCGWSTVIRYRKFMFHLSHWATATANYDDDKSLRSKLLSLSGHTHKKDKFHNETDLNYNVALDAHNNFPVSLDEVIEDLKARFF